jgi:hypothetical protein
VWDRPNAFERDGEDCVCLYATFKGCESRWQTLEQIWQNSAVGGGLQVGSLAYAVNKAFDALADGDFGPIIFLVVFGLLIFGLYELSQKLKGP